MGQDFSTSVEGRETVDYKAALEECVEILEAHGEVCELTDVVDVLRQQVRMNWDCNRALSRLSLLLLGDEFHFPEYCLLDRLLSLCQKGIRFPLVRSEESAPTPLTEGGQWMAGDGSLVDPSGVLWLSAAAICAAAGLKHESEVWARAKAEVWPCRIEGGAMYPVRCLPVEWVEAICFPEGRGALRAGDEGDGVDGVGAVGERIYLAEVAADGVLWLSVAAICAAVGIDEIDFFEWANFAAVERRVDGGGVFYRLQDLPEEWVEVIAFPPGRHVVWTDGRDVSPGYMEALFRQALTECSELLGMPGSPRLTDVPKVLRERLANQEDADYEATLALIECRELLEVRTTPLTEVPKALGVRLAADETAISVFKDVLERCHGLLGMSEERGYTEIPEVLTARLGKDVPRQDLLGEAIELEEIPPTPLTEGGQDAFPVWNESSGRWERVKGNAAGDETEWVTANEICAAVGCHRATVTKWAKKHKGAGRREVHEGRFHYLYAVADLPVEWREALAQADGVEEG